MYNFSKFKKFPFRSHKFAFHMHASCCSKMSYSPVLGLSTGTCHCTRDKNFPSVCTDWRGVSMRKRPLRPLKLYPHHASGPAHELPGRTSIIPPPCSTLHPPSRNATCSPSPACSTFPTEFPCSGTSTSYIAHLCFSLLQTT